MLSIASTVVLRTNPANQLCSVFQNVSENLWLKHSQFDVLIKPQTDRRQSVPVAGYRDHHQDAFFWPQRGDADDAVLPAAVRH